MKVRDANANIRIVSRMWEQRLSRQMERFLDVDSVLSAADLAAPAFAGAAVGIDITQTIQIQGVEYSMIRLRVAPGSFLDGMEVGTLQSQQNMDIVLCERDGVAEVKPPTDRLVRVDDQLVVFARHDRILDIVSRNQGRRK
jgi:Trk K+ transport system NAD-binding subunit